MPDPDVLPTDDELADFADTILDLARWLSLKGHERSDVIPLTGTEIAVIREIDRSARISPSEIAEILGLKRSNVSTAIRSLEERGLLEKRHPVGNARSVELVGTPAAKANLKRVREVWAQRLRETPSGILAEGLTSGVALKELADSLAGERREARSLSG